MIAKPPASLVGVGAEEWTRVVTLLVDRGQWGAVFGLLLVEGAAPNPTEVPSVWQDAVAAAFATETLQRSFPHRTVAWRNARQSRRVSSASPRGRWYAATSPLTSLRCLIRRRNSVPYPNNSPLSQLIDVVNERFGTDFNQADQLFFDQIIETAMADDGLRQAAAVNRTISSSWCSRACWRICSSSAWIRTRRSSSDS